MNLRVTVSDVYVYSTLSTVHSSIECDTHDRVRCHGRLSVFSPTMEGRINQTQKRMVSLETSTKVRQRESSSTVSLRLWLSMDGTQQTQIQPASQGSKVAYGCLLRLFRLERRRWWVTERLYGLSIGWPMFTHDGARDLNSHC